MKFLTTAPNFRGLTWPRDTAFPSPCSPHTDIRKEVKGSTLPAANSARATFHQVRTNCGTVPNRMSKPKNLTPPPLRNFDKYSPGYDVLWGVATGWTEGFLRLLRIWWVFFTWDAWLASLQNTEIIIIIIIIIIMFIFQNKELQSTIITIRQPKNRMINITGCLWGKSADSVGHPKADRFSAPGGASPTFIPNPRYMIAFHARHVSTPHFLTWRGPCL